MFPKAYRSNVEYLDFLKTVENCKADELYDIIKAPLDLKFGTV